MALPRYDEIHLPLLKLILHKRIHNIKEAVGILAKEFCLTLEELNDRVPSGTRKFYSQVNFSKMLLVEAGLVFRNITPLRATDKARSIIAHNPKKITKRLLDELAGRKQAQKIQKQKSEVNKQLQNSYDEYLKKLLKEINDPVYFEKLSGMVLSKVCNIDCSSQVEITPPSNDKGIDGIIHLSKNEVSKVYFQSKFLSYGTVGAPLVQQFSGALDGVYGTKGYYVTTSKFSSKAYDYVKKLRSKEIILIDGHKLVELIFKYNLENEIIKLK